MGALLANGCVLGEHSGIDAYAAPPPVDGGDVDAATALDGGGPSCGNGRIQCGDTCADLQNDPSHCGTCPRACDLGQVCQSGNCVAGPDCRQTACPGLSYCDLNTGHCLPGCANTSQCASNEHCDIASHGCLCDDGFHRCNGACASNTAVASCGSSCTACPGDPGGHGSASCNGTSCSISCANNYHWCSNLNRCASNSDVATCGSRCEACPADPNGQGTPTCSGTCGLSCPGGTIYCNGRCLPCSDPAGTPTCQNSACFINCNGGAHWNGSSCVQNVVCTAETAFTACGTALHCDFARGYCVEGAGPCFRDDQCGDHQYCELTTGQCVTLTPTWDCTNTCYNLTGACGSGAICINGTCVLRELTGSTPCNPWIRCGGNFACSEYDWQCHFMSCNSCDCDLGLECVNGSTCSGCGPYGGGGSSYNSCWPVRDYTDCTTGQSYHGFACVDGHPTMRWSCTDDTDCASAYTCGPQSVCIPYFESACSSDEDCHDTYSFRCDQTLHLCFPKAG
jgi:hypothetical protein